MGKLQKEAYRKAGHAVASCVLMRRFGKITIFPKGDNWGSMAAQVSSINGISEQTSKTKNNIEDEVIIHFAGVVAERLFSSGYNWHGVRVENLTAVERVECTGPSDAETEAYLDSLFILARDLIKVPRYWNAVETLAHELLKERTIGYQKVRQIISDILDGNI